MSFKHTNPNPPITDIRKHVNTLCAEGKIAHDYDFLLECLEQKVSVAAISRLFNVSKQTMYSWLELVKDVGDYKPSEEGQEDE